MKYIGNYDCNLCGIHLFFVHMEPIHNFLVGITELVRISFELLILLSTSFYSGNVVTGRYLYESTEL